MRNHVWHVFDVGPEKGVHVQLIIQSERPLPAEAYALIEPVVEAGGVMALQLGELVAVEDGREEHGVDNAQVDDTTRE